MKKLQTTATLWGLGILVFGLASTSLQANAHHAYDAQKPTLQAEPQAPKGQMRADNHEFHPFPAYPQANTTPNNGAQHPQSEGEYQYQLNQNASHRDEYHEHYRHWYHGENHKFKKHQLEDHNLR